jgi:hypothetical protein
LVGFPAGTTKYNSGYNTQNLVASLTMKFGAPPPAPGTSAAGAASSTTAADAPSLSRILRLG